MARQPNSKKKKRTRARIEWDYVSTEHAICPFCRQHWVGAPEVLVSQEHRVGLLAGLSIRFGNEVQARVLQVLRAAYGRWLTIDELMLSAYSDLPEVEQPSNQQPVRTAVYWLRKAINDTDYHIETRRTRHGLGVRLIKRESKYAHLLSSRRPPPPEYAFADR